MCRSIRQVQLLVRRITTIRRGQDWRTERNRKRGEGIWIVCASIRDPRENLKRIVTRSECVIPDLEDHIGIGPGRIVDLVVRDAVERNTEGTGGSSPNRLRRSRRSYEDVSSKSHLALCFLTHPPESTNDLAILVCQVRVTVQRGLGSRIKTIISSYGSKREKLKLI